MTQLARHTDASPLRSYERLSNRQTHTRTTNEIPLIFAAIEFVKDHGLFKTIDSSAAVSDTSGHRIPSKFHGNRNRLIFRRIQVSVSINCTRASFVRSR